MNNDKRKMRHRGIGIPYTRMEYIKKHPEGKEKQMKWTYGNPNTPFKYQLLLKSTNDHYLSVNSLDAVRVAMNYILQGFGQENFYIHIHPYPHVFLREHGLLGVAKAERLAKGMKHSFGRPMTRVAQVHPNQVLITLRINENLLKSGQHALDVASKKLGCASKIEITTQ